MPANLTCLAVALVACSPGCPVRLCLIAVPSMPALQEASGPSVALKVGAALRREQWDETSERCEGPAREGVSPERDVG